MEAYTWIILVLVVSYIYSNQTSMIRFDVGVKSVTYFFSVCSFIVQLRLCVRRQGFLSNTFYDLPVYAEPNFSSALRLIFCLQSAFLFILQHCQFCQLRLLFSPCKYAFYRCYQEPQLFGGMQYCGFHDVFVQRRNLVLYLSYAFPARSMFPMPFISLYWYVFSFKHENLDHLSRCLLCLNTVRHWPKGIEAVRRQVVQFNSSAYGVNFSTSQRAMKGPTTCLPVSLTTVITSSITNNK